MSITDELREWVTDHYSGWKSKQAEGIAIADRIDAEYQKAIRELNNFADASVLLPVDADGEPWHINDEFEINEGIAHVNGIGDNRLFYIDNDGMQWTRADNKLHHHKPTVEDVLTEFGIDWEHESDCEDRAALLKEYASKLRLAKEDA